MNNNIKAKLKNAKKNLAVSANTVLQQIGYIVSQNHVKNMATRNHKNAKIVILKNGDYYIQWYNFNHKTNCIERIRKTFDLNRLENLKYRKDEASKLVSLINTALNCGWNYFDTIDKNNDKLIPEMQKALDIILTNLGKKSHESYSSIFNVFTKWLIDCKYNTLCVSQFTSTHFTDYLYYRKDNSPSNINAHIILIKNIFKTMLQITKVIDSNPLDVIKTIQIPQTDRFESINEYELKTIYNYFKDNDIFFLLFTQCLIYAIIRPGHIYMLQRKQIDFNNDTIRIIGNNTKNKKNSVKQLLRPLKESMLHLGIDKLSDEHYLFGKDFKPSLLPYNNLYDSAQKKWKKMCIKTGIQKKMYALKHTFAQMYISNNANVDVAWLQNQMEHSSLAETQTYIAQRSLKKINENNVNLPKY